MAGSDVNREAEEFILQRKVQAHKKWTKPIFSFFGFEFKYFLFFGVGCWDMMQESGIVSFYGCGSRPV